MSEICKKIGIIADKRLLDHQLNISVKECPERLRQLYNSIEYSEIRDRLVFYAPHLIAMEKILQIHSKPYLEQVRKYCVHDNPFAYDKDTYLMEDSLHTSQLAAGGCLELADAIMAEEIDCGFALIRPPGHHAEPGRGIGFCLLNNIALTARHLLECYGLSRILIFDFDAHHGNGTQNCFYGSRQVLTLSIHQENLFPPNSGSVDEFGEGDGYGYNVNIPVKSTFGDLEFNCLTGKVIQEIIDQYLPQIILVSAGFDGHAGDTMSGLNLTGKWYKQITEMLKYNAKQHCNNKLLYILEGGYVPNLLEESVFLTLQAMLEPTPTSIGFAHSPRAINLLNLDLYPVLKKKWAF
jgi:acetoin utilization deacetylase AcuC-like enzyme